nr:hypothetical protein [Tanacetum cinerariifolium]
MTDSDNQELQYCGSKLRRREIMPYPKFTKIIINHFLSLNPSLLKEPSSGMHTIKDDGVISRLKFVRIGEDFQEYGRAIPNTIGKGSQGKKSVITPKPTSVEVFNESDPELAKRQSGSIRKLTAKEQLAVDTMQAIKKSKKSSRSRPHARGSSKGTGVPDEVKAKLTSQSFRDQKMRVTILKKKTLMTKWVSTDEEEEKQDDDDDRSIDLEETDDEDKDDEFVHGDEYVHEDVDEEMKDVEDAKTGKDDEEITDDEKIEATKGDYEQAGKHTPTSSSLSVSSGFGNQFLNISSDASLIGTTKKSTYIEINSLLDIQIQ